MQQRAVRIRTRSRLHLYISLSGEMPSQGQDMIIPLMTYGTTQLFDTHMSLPFYPCLFFSLSLSSFLSLVHSITINLPLASSALFFYYYTTSVRRRFLNPFPPYTFRIPEAPGIRHPGQQRTTICRRCSSARCRKSDNKRPIITGIDASTFSLCTSPIALHL